MQELYLFYRKEDKTQGGTVTCSPPRSHKEQRLIPPASNVQPRFLEAGLADAEREAFRLRSRKQTLQGTEESGTHSGVRRCSWAEASEGSRRRRGCAVGRAGPGEGTP